jgi:hypothetical protein
MNILPYGISSRGMAGMRAQVIVNDDSNNTVVGVYDPNRPDVEVGEVLLYSIGSATIHLTKNGVIAVRTGIATLNIQSDGHIDIAGNVNINGTLSINGVQIG